MTIAIVAVIILAVVLGLVFGLGRKYAETAIDDSDITLTMALSNPTDDGFVRCCGGRCVETPTVLTPL